MLMPVPTLPAQIKELVVQAKAVDDRPDIGLALIDLDRFQA